MNTGRSNGGRSSKNAKTADKVTGRAARNTGYRRKQNYYYWLRKLRAAATEKSLPQVVEMELPAAKEETIYIHFHEAELILPAGTDVEAIAAILRSIEQL